MDGTDDPGAALSTTLTLEAIQQQLRQRADSQVRHALQIAWLRLVGYRTGEIRERLELAPDEFRHARGWLRDAIAATARDGLD